MPLPHHTKKNIVLFVGDALFIVLSTYLAVFLRTQVFIPVLQKYTGATTFFVLIFLASFYIFDLYNFTYKIRSTLYLARFLFAVLAGTLTTAMAYYLFPPWRIARGILLINVTLMSILLFSWRLLCYYIWITSAKPRKTVIVGGGRAGEVICEALRRSNDFQICGFLDDSNEKAGTCVSSFPVLGGIDSLGKLVEEHGAESIVVTIKDEKKPDLLRAIIEAKMNGIEIHNMASLYENLTGKLPVLHLSEGWMAYTPFHGIRRSVYNVRGKRLIDIVLSFLGLLVSLPVSVLTAIAIKIDSKGPVLFRQQRVGLNEKEFELLKFRSMESDAEADGAVWAKEKDPRATRVGRVIRKARIDEIPQMWNVLKGEMSFIGPRPERPEFVAKLKRDIPFYSFRHAVNPGITGWAQVNYRYGASKEDAIEKLQYDLFYIKNLSAFLDFHILVKTVRVVLFGKGAR